MQLFLSLFLNCLVKRQLFSLHLKTAADSAVWTARKAHSTTIVSGECLDACLPFILMDGGSIQYSHSSHLIFLLPVLSFYHHLFYLSTLPLSYSTICPFSPSTILPPLILAPLLCAICSPGPSLLLFFQAPDCFRYLEKSLRGPVLCALLTQLASTWGK